MTRAGRRQLTTEVSKWDASRPASIWRCTEPRPVRTWHIAVAKLRSVFFRGRREADLGEELISPRSRNRTARGCRNRPASCAFAGSPIVWRCRSGEGGEPRQPGHGLRRPPGARTGTRAAPGARLAVHRGRGRHSRARDRRNAAIFSVISRALPPAVAESRDPVDIYQNGPGGWRTSARTRPTRTWPHTRTSSRVPPQPHSPAGHLVDAPRPEGMGEHTTATYLDVLGLRPALGRWFTTAEDALNAPPVVVLAMVPGRRASRPIGSVVGRIIQSRGARDYRGGRSRESRRGGELRRRHRLLAAHENPRSARRAPGDVPARHRRRRLLRQGAAAAGRHRGRARAAITALGVRLAREFPKEDKGAGISVYASRDVRIHPQMDRFSPALPSRCWRSSGSCWPLPAATSPPCCWCGVPPRSRRSPCAWPWRNARAAGASSPDRKRVLALAGGAAGCVLAWWTMRWLTTLDCRW